MASVLVNFMHYNVYYYYHCAMHHHHLSPLRGENKTRELIKCQQSDTSKKNSSRIKDANRQLHMH